MTTDRGTTSQATGLNDPPARKRLSNPKGKRVEIALYDHIGCLFAC